MYKRFKESYVSKKQLFFIHIPKNAGTSIEDFGKKHNLIWGRFYKFGVGCNKASCCNRWHIPPKDFINEMGWNIYFKDKVPFAVVRNPYTRIVSEYLYNLMYAKEEPTPEGLNLFVESIINKRGYENDCHLLPQSEYTQVPMIEENQIVWKQSRGEIEILRFENIDQDFRELLNKYNYHIDDELPKHNTRAKKVTMDDLTASSIYIINRVYHDDFVNFGYDKIISRENYTKGTIWMYWEQGGIPKGYNGDCIKEWIKINPTWDVKLLDYKTALHYVPELDKLPKMRTVQNRADYLRLYLLEKYGGVWADASVWPLVPLDNWLDVELKKTHHLFMYKFDPISQGRITSNWFIAVSKSNNYLIKRWREEFEKKMMTNNEYPYYICHHTLTELMKTHPKIKKSLDLLTITEKGPHSCDLNSYMWKRCPNKIKLLKT